MALELPEVLFLIYGGNDGDVLFRRRNNKLINLRFMGHITHVEAQRIMKIVDVLLMPYQQEVSIGVDKHDTGRWMSPMKMFEYMASGVPIISSDLPVLREVLSDGVNCLLVESNNKEAWMNALLNLMNEPKIAQRIGLSAHLDYKNSYTWLNRAKELVIVAQLL